MEEIYEILKKVDHSIFGKMVQKSIEVSKQSKEIGEDLIDYYEKCNTHEQAIANNIMLALCGMSFEDLLEHAYTADSYVLQDIDHSTVAVLTVIENNNVEDSLAYTGEDCIARAENDFKKYTGVAYSEYKERFVLRKENQGVILGGFVGTEINIMTANLK